MLSTPGSVRLFTGNELRCFASPELSDSSLSVRTAGTSCPDLARRMARHLGMELAGAEVSTFPNGETKVKILSRVRICRRIFPFFFLFFCPCLRCVPEH
jgi:hypothetical protein